MLLLLLLLLWIFVDDAKICWVEKLLRHSWSWRELPRRQLEAPCGKRATGMGPLSCQ